MSYKIVVCRYNEDIDWLNSEIDNCIIYNKGNALNIKNEILTDNVGRESESYLRFIISNYHNLPEVVVFTQAKISDHNGYNLKYLMELKNEALSNFKSRNYSTFYNDKVYLSSDWNLMNRDIPQIYKNGMITFGNWLRYNLKIDFQYPFYSYWNGIFAVNKQLILNHSIEYYEKLILQVNYHDNPTEGHFFERAWFYIFM